MNDDPHLKGVNAVFGGVSTVWLSKAFRIPKAKVERKLISLKPIGQGTGGAALYDLVDAAGYLATPQTGIAEYLKTIKPEQLPEKLRESYWNSMIKKQKWEEKARHLWRTEDVLEAMGDVFKLIRTTLQILPDDIHRAMPLTPEQRVSVTRVIEGRYLDAGLLEHCGCCLKSLERARAADDFGYTGLDERAGTVQSLILIPSVPRRRRGWHRNGWRREIWWGHHGAREREDAMRRARLTIKKDRQ